MSLANDGVGSSSFVDNWSPSCKSCKVAIGNWQSYAQSAWRNKPIKQDVVYSDQDALAKAIGKLKTLPPLVSPGEIVKLKDNLRSVALGEALLLQGGDCAELFSYCTDGAIDAKLKVLLQMSLVLVWGANKPVVRVARMAGQFAKPRSSPIESLPNGRQIPSFRGDILNGYEHDQREPDPARLVEAYFHSAATLNHVRAQLASGLADLHNPLDWNLGHVRDKELQMRYQRIVTSIHESLRFMHTVGADTSRQISTVDIFTSHEGLLLDYEEALTRLLPNPKNGTYGRPTLSHDGNTGDENGEGDQRADREARWYNTSAHFLWIGDRTRQLDGAHVEYFRGLENPIGIKVGPSMKADELVRLLDNVNPRREVGKITLITRYGEDKVSQLLGAHIDAVKESGHIVVWQCDPMHG